MQVSVNAFENVLYYVVVKVFVLIKLNLIMILLENGIIITIIDIIVYMFRFISFNPTYLRLSPPSTSFKIYINLISLFSFQELILREDRAVTSVTKGK